MLDLTMLLNTNGEKNAIEIMQIGKPGKDIVRYVCGIFIVMNFTPHDISNFVKNYQYVIPFEQGLERIKRRFFKPTISANNEAEVECEIFCKDIKIELQCSITQKKIKVPIKG
jgi:hypothetical protein